MKGYIIDYINENEFRKLGRALKKYNMLAYKKLYFECYPKLRTGEFQGELVSKDETREKYELVLPTDSMFRKVHGDVTLKYIVYKEQNIVMLDTITPTDILLEGHMAELTTYKGVKINKSINERDMFKIDLLNMIQK